MVPRILTLAAAGLASTAAWTAAAAAGPWPVVVLSLGDRRNRRHSTLRRLAAGRRVCAPWRCHCAAGGLADLVRRTAPAGGAGWMAGASNTEARGLGQPDPVPGGDVRTGRPDIAAGPGRTRLSADSGREHVIHSGAAGIPHCEPRHSGGALRSSGDLGLSIGWRCGAVRHDGRDRSSQCRSGRPLAVASDAGRRRCRRTQRQSVRRNRCSVEAGTCFRRRWNSTGPCASVRPSPTSTRRVRCLRWSCRSQPRSAWRRDDDLSACSHWRQSVAGLWLTGSRAAMVGGAVGLAGYLTVVACRHWTRMQASRQSGLLCLILGRPGGLVSAWRGTYPDQRRVADPKIPGASPASRWHASRPCSASGSVGSAPSPRGLRPEAGALLPRRERAQPGAPAIGRVGLAGCGTLCGAAGLQPATGVATIERSDASVSCSSGLRAGWLVTR